MGHEPGHPGHLVVGRDVDPAGGGRGERGAEEAEEEQRGSVHGRAVINDEADPNRRT